LYENKSCVVHESAETEFIDQKGYLITYLGSMYKQKVTETVLKHFCSHADIIIKCIASTNMFQYQRALKHYTVPQ